MWGKECFEKIVGTIGTLISIDSATENWDELEYARLCIRMPIGAEPKLRKKMNLNGILCSISIEEESSFMVLPRCCCESWDKKTREDSSSNSLVGNGFQHPFDSECASINNIEVLDGKYEFQTVGSPEAIPTAPNPEGQARGSKTFNQSVCHICTLEEVCFQQKKVIIVRTHRDTLQWKVG